MECVILLVPCKNVHDGDAEVDDYVDEKKK